MNIFACIKPKTFFLKSILRNKKKEMCLVFDLCSEGGIDEIEENFLKLKYK